MELYDSVKEMFDVNYMSEKFTESPEYRQECLDTINNIIATHGWNDTYLAIYKYLLNEVKGKDAYVNFACLYSFYKLVDKNIPNPIEFCSILANSFNMCDCWYRGGSAVSETIAEILITSELLDEEEFDDYRVYDDPRF